MLEDQIALLEAKTPAPKYDDREILSNLMHEQIMNYYKQYYKSTRGIVATVIHEVDERAKRAQEEADRLTEMRQSMYTYCVNLLHALWDIEKEGILRYDEGAFISQVDAYVAESEYESCALFTRHGDSLVVYSSPTKPCRISYNVNHQEIMLSDILTEGGEPCSKEEAFDFFMSIASEFLNAFIANNNIAR